MQVPSRNTEQPWLSLQRHLERSDRFTLVLLISADPSVLETFYRRLKIQTPCVQIIPLDGTAAHWADTLESALAPDGVASEHSRASRSRDRASEPER